MGVIMIVVIVVIAGTGRRVHASQFTTLFSQRTKSR